MRVHKCELSITPRLAISTRQYFCDLWLLTAVRISLCEYMLPSWSHFCDGWPSKLFLIFSLLLYFIGSERFPFYLNISGVHAALQASGNLYPFLSMRNNNASCDHCCLRFDEVWPKRWGITCVDWSGGQYICFGVLHCCVCQSLDCHTMCVLSKQTDTF